MLPTRHIDGSSSKHHEQRILISKYSARYQLLIGFEAMPIQRSDIKVLVDTVVSSGATVLSLNVS